MQTGRAEHWNLSWKFHFNLGINLTKDTILTSCVSIQAWTVVCIYQSGVSRYYTMLLTLYEQNTEYHGIKAIYKLNYKFSELIIAT